MEPQVLVPPGVLAALERVIGSRTFARSGRHRSLLRHLVGKTLDGRSCEIKESTIALEVFGRDSYDPQVDAQVRVEVGKLRERLERYYANEAAAETVRIEIPKGVYTPVFQVVAASPAETTAPLELPKSPKRRVFGWIVAAALVAAAVTIAIRIPLRSPATAVRTSIAVLPFEDLSPARDIGYFCSGITDELISDLAALQVFRVFARSSVAQYKDRPLDLQKIARQLNVHAVVEGSVRKDQNRVRIAVRLIDVRQSLLLWNAEYDRDFDNVLEIQREISQAIAKAFNRTLFDTARALLRQRTNNHQAYHHYFRAAYLFTSDPELSIVHYRAAVAADPGYALAWAGLAEAWIRLAEYEWASPEKARKEATAAAAMAISLDPQLAEAQHVSGIVKLYYERDWQAAGQALLKAIELDRVYGNTVGNTRV